MSPANGFFPHPQFETRDHQFHHRRRKFDILTDELGLDFGGRETQVRVQKLRSGFLVDASVAGDKMLIRWWRYLLEGAARAFANSEELAEERANANHGGRYREGVSGGRGRRFI